MLINVKMPTIVGILTFMIMINFMLSWVEHVKSFITSEPDQGIHCLLSECCINIWTKMKNTTQQKVLKGK